MTAIVDTLSSVLCFCSAHGHVTDDDDEDSPDVAYNSPKMRRQLEQVTEPYFFTHVADDHIIEEAPCSPVTVTTSITAMDSETKEESWAHLLSPYQDDSPSIRRTRTDSSIFTQQHKDDQDNPAWEKGEVSVPEYHTVPSITKRGEEEEKRMSSAASRLETVYSSATNISRVSPSPSPSPSVASSQGDRAWTDDALEGFLRSTLVEGTGLLVLKRKSGSKAARLQERILSYDPTAMRLNWVATTGVIRKSNGISTQDILDVRRDGRSVTIVTNSNKMKKRGTIGHVTPDLDGKCFQASNERDAQILREILFFLRRKAQAAKKAAIIKKLKSADNYHVRARPSRSGAATRKRQNTSA